MLPEPLPQEHADAVIVLGELRSAVRMSPNSADARLKLAQGLYLIGNLDAALDECRVALGSTQTTPEPICNSVSH